MYLKSSSETINSLILIIVPTFVSYLLLPYIRNFSFKYIILDKPNSRKIHTKPVPNIGGLAIFISYLFGIFCLKLLTNLEIQNLEIFIIISNIILIIGLLDDLYNLSAMTRLGLQFLVISFIYFKGINISNLNLEFLNINSYQIPNLLSFLVTSFWIVGVINAINWIDGLNGLASGVIIFTLLAIAKIAISKSLMGLYFIALIMSGACLGFLLHNLKPNNIIMGDNGSNFLGFNLSILCLYAGANKSIYSHDLSINPLIPVFLLAYPIFDMSRVIIGRIKRNSSPFLPDNSHFHHILLRNGFSNTGTIIIIFTLTIFLASLSFLFI